VIRRGEIYWVLPGRGTGREQSGRRPGLVIQNDINNEFSDTTIVALMTTHRFPRLYPTHVEISARESGLPESSTIMLEQILTVAVDRLGQKVGQVGPTTFEDVDKALHYTLGILNCPFSS
jgi:mRNA interferase MazF